MKKIIYSFLIVFFLISCSENENEFSGSDDVDITSLGLVYKNASKNTNGSTNLIKVDLIVNNEIKESGEIIATASVPAPSGNFTVSERRSVSLKNLAAYVQIPSGAHIEPLDGAPVLGIPGDFSVDRKYKVTADDGITSKIWTIKINPLPLVNLYEGIYRSYGHFEHPTSPRDFDLEKYIVTVDANTIGGDHSDIGSLGYRMTIKINPDNSVVVRQFDSNGSEIGEMVSGTENKYNPATKTFTLNYRYSGSNGWRTISETLVLN